MFPKKSSYNDIKQKRVLMLGTNWAMFENNKMATGFFDWKLVHPIFADLNYFKNVVLIDKSFSGDPPDVIIDEENKMKEVFKRIPRLQSEYLRQGNLYIRK